jgi:GTP-binding protein
MKITSAEFVTSAPDLDSCPESPLAEIAFIGRSNVGKSTLINFLSGRKGLAKVSSTPGHTTLINFFLMNKAWTMVDLPGYGYAKRSRAQKGRFNEFVSDYLANRPNLHCVFILIDAKISPQTLDLDFIEWVVHCQIPFALIFTKTDKVKASFLKKNRAAFMKSLAEHCDGEPNTFTCSSKAETGRQEIIKFIGLTLGMG